MGEDSGNRQTGEKNENALSAEIPGSLQERSPDSACAPASSVPSPGRTLEQIIELTGEFSHLNELVMIHIDKAGGFTGTDAYFRTVQPILDLLEVEIRIRCNSGITQQQMKLVVQDWIDQEIQACTEGTGTHVP